MFRLFVTRCARTTAPVFRSPLLRSLRADISTAAGERMSVPPLTSRMLPAIYPRSLLVSQITRRPTTSIVLPSLLPQTRRGMAVYNRWGSKQPVIVPDSDDSNGGGYNGGGRGGNNNRWWQRFTNRSGSSSKAKRGRWSRFFVMFAGGIGVLCLFNIYEVPFSGRSRVILIPRSFELGLGEASYQSIVRQAGRNVLPQNHPATQLVRSVAEDIIKNNQSLPTDLRWEYTVINSPVPNAMVVPGGKVVVYTGLIDAISQGGAEVDLAGIGIRKPSRFGQSDTRDLLSVVLAHEIGHAIARHSAEKMTVFALIALPAQLAVWSVLNSPELANWVCRLSVYLLLFVSLRAWRSPLDAVCFCLQISNFLFSLPFSRYMEREADLLGLHLLAEAGNPSFLRAPEMFVRLHRATERMRGRSSGGRVSSKIDLFDTHPSDAKRIKAIEKAIPDVIAAHKHRLPPDITPRAPITLDEPQQKAIPPPKRPSQSQPQPAVSQSSRDRPFGGSATRREPAESLPPRQTEWSVEVTVSDGNSTGSRPPAPAPAPAPVSARPSAPPAPRSVPERDWEAAAPQQPARSAQPARPKQDEWEWGNESDFSTGKKKSKSKKEEDEWKEWK